MHQNASFFRIKSMENTIFQSDSIAPDTLFEGIIGRIQREQHRQSLMRAGIGFGIFLLCITLAVPVGNDFVVALRESGIMDYGSLIISDFGAVVVDWQDFALSILMALPVIEVGEALAVSAGMLYALRLVVGDPRQRMTHIFS